MIVHPVRTRIFRERENLERFITRYIPHVKEGSIIVVTSKIAALAEGRTATVTSRRAKIQLIKDESEVAIRTKWVWLTVKDGMMMASAGIDESNADGKIILLPKDSFAVARTLCRALKKHYRLKRLGVMLTDSRTIPLRAGITGVSLGYAGFRGIRDYRGTGDIFGRIMKISRVDIPDSLAAAAVLTMGEGAEQRPLAVIEQAPVEFRDAVYRRELAIDIRDDMYRPLFKKMPRVKKRKIQP